MKSRSDRARLGVQIFFFVLIAAIAVNHGLDEAGVGALPILSSASLHALCPFGGVVSTYQYVTTDLTESCGISGTSCLAGLCI